jgi:hypothetical protein
MLVPVAATTTTTTTKTVETSRAREKERKAPRANDVYGYYGKKGHWAWECRKKKRDAKAQAHVAHGEEEEQSILMALAFIPNTESTLPALPCRWVEIVE